MTPSIRSATKSLQTTATLIRRAGHIQPQILRQLERARTEAEFRRELFVDALVLTSETLMDAGQLTLAQARVLKSMILTAIEAEQRVLRDMVGFIALLTGYRVQSSRGALRLVSAYRRAHSSTSSETADFL